MTDNWSDPAATFNDATSDEIYRKKREAKIKCASKYTKKNKAKYSKLKNIDIAIPKNITYTNGDNVPYDAAIRKVALEALKRKWKHVMPRGKYGMSRLWLPSECERTSCCEDIKVSSDFPFTFLSHCRTMKHVATLYNVDIKELRYIVKQSELYLLACDRLGVD